MTSQPRSASKLPAYGPATCPLISMATIPSRAPAIISRQSGATDMLLRIIIDLPQRDLVVHRATGSDSNNACRGKPLCLPGFRATTGVAPTPLGLAYRHPSDLGYLQAYTKR